MMEQLLPALLALLAGMLISGVVVYGVMAERHERARRRERYTARIERHVRAH